MTKPQTNELSRCQRRAKRRQEQAMNAYQHMVSVADPQYQKGFTKPGSQKCW